MSVDRLFIPSLFWGAFRFALGGGLALAVVVAHANTPPTITPIPDQILDEDTSVTIPFTIGDAETPVGSLTLVATSDTYLLPTPQSVFGGSGASRTITITPAPNFFGTGHMRVRVNDADGGTQSTLFTVKVNSVNDPPRISVIPNQTVVKNMSRQVLFSAGDQESDITFAAMSSNASLIPVSGIVFESSQYFRIYPAADQTGICNVRIQVKDAAGATASTLFAVTVYPSQAPTITPIPNQVIIRNAASAPIAFTIGDADTRVGDLTLVATTSDPTLIPAANIAFLGAGAKRQVVIAPAANRIGICNVRIRVNDADGMTNSTLFSVTVNAPPTISAIADQIHGSGGTSPAIPFTLGDAETPVESLVLQGLSGNVALIPLSGIVFGGSGASRTVTLIPAVGQAGSCKVRVQVKDAHGAVASSLFTVVVYASSNPTITAIASQSLIKNTASPSIPFVIGDAETPAASLTLEGTTDNPALIPASHIAFGGSGAARTVTLMPATDQTGTCHVQIRVADGSGGASTRLFLVTVHGANTNPTITAIASQNLQTSTPSAAIPFTIGDAETPLESLYLTGMTGDTALMPLSGIRLGGSGASRTVTLSPAPGRTGTCNVRIQVKDTNGGVNSVVFAVTVANEILTIQIPDASNPGSLVPMDFIRIPAGTFTMGSNDPLDMDGNECKPPHTVTIPRPFFLARTECTQAQWRAVMNANPSYHCVAYGGASTDDFARPVEHMTWGDVRTSGTGFLDKLAAVVPGYTFRLPSEAEWEYACRAGTTTAYSFGENPDDLWAYACYGAEAPRPVTLGVASKKPNPWGLYDMHGNVSEMCEDDWHGNYADAPVTAEAWIHQPTPSSGKVRRDGSFFSSEAFVRSARRSQIYDLDLTTGFRPVLVVP